MNVEEAAQLHRETIRMLEKNVSLMKINTIAKVRSECEFNTALFVFFFGGCCKMYTSRLKINTKL